MVIPSRLRASARGSSNRYGKLEAGVGPPRFLSKDEEDTQLVVPVGVEDRRDGGGAGITTGSQIPANVAERRVMTWTSVASAEYAEARRGTSSSSMDRVMRVFGPQGKGSIPSGPTLNKPLVRFT